MDMLTKQRYEKDELFANILFLSSHEDGFEKLDEMYFLRFARGEKIPFDRNHLRQIRKILAGAGDCALLFGKTPSQSKFTARAFVKENFIKCFPICVTLCGGDGWIFKLNGASLFRSSGGRVLAISNQVDAAKQALKKELREDFDNLSPLLDALEKQKHGTSAVFVNLTENKVAKEWYENLENTGRAIQTSGLNINTMEKSQEGLAPIAKLCRVDGALIVDTASKEIVYFAAILDGIANPHICGNPEGGARRNGLKTHLANLVDSCLKSNQDFKMAAVIYSEDEKVTTVLGSQLKKDIEKNIQ